jgi:hypothetical protein
MMTTGGWPAAPRHGSPDRQSATALPESPISKTNKKLSSSRDATTWQCGVLQTSDVFAGPQPTNLATTVNNVRQTCTGLHHWWCCGNPSRLL